MWGPMMMSVMETRMNLDEGEQLNFATLNERGDLFLDESEELIACLLLGTEAAQHA